MLSVWRREFLSLCKGIKAVILLTIFIGFTYMIASLGEYFPFLNQGVESSSSLSGGLRFLILFLGFIFVTMVSHDMLNREVDSQTIRFLVTKTSRISIVLGKFLGVFSFWFFVTTLSYIPVVVKAGSFDLLDYVRLIQYLFLMVSVTLFLSCIIKKPSYSLLLGLCLGISYPVLGGVSMIKEGLFWDQMKYISLFNYVSDMNEGLYVPFIISMLFVLFSVMLFQRKDL